MADDPRWALVLAHQGLLVAYVARRLPWACRDHELYADTISLGRILLYRAAATYDGRSTTFAGWALRVLEAQLLHRVRDAQLLPPAGSAHLDHDPAVRAALADERPRATREGLRALGAELRAAVCAAQPLVAHYAPPSRRRALLGLFARAWGHAHRRAATAARVAAHGITRRDIAALDRAWRPGFYADEEEELT